jgi:hypothetical protein
MDEREWTVTRMTTYKVDVDALRDEFGPDFELDAVDTEDAFEVVAHAWESGARDPFFIPIVFDDFDYDLSRAANSHSEPDA